MAITAAIVVTPSGTVSTGQLITAMVTITNANATPANLSSLSLIAVPTSGAGVTGSMVCGNVNALIGPNVNTAIPASSGTLVVPVTFVFNAPSGAYNTSTPSLTYTLQGTVYTTASGNDAAVNITTTTVTVKYAVSFSASES